MEDGADNSQPEQLAASAAAQHTEPIEHSIDESSAQYADGATTISSTHSDRTPAELAADHAGQLHAVVALAKAGRWRPAHMELPASERDALFSLIERLAKEVRVLTEMAV